ncbi:MAG: response regulator [Anaerolineae bacterium]
MRKPRILIIDDDEKWRTRLKFIMESEGYSVSSVASFDAARDILSTLKFDLVTVDIKLNDGAGDEIGPEWEFLLELVGHSHAIVISGHATPQMVRDALKRYGAVDFVEKQHFDFQELKEIVRRALKIQPSGAERETGVVEKESVWLQEELLALKRNLHRLRSQKNIYAPADVPIHLLNQIEELEKEVKNLEEKLRALNAQ